MTKIDENTKVTLTLEQLKKLVKEATIEQQQQWTEKTGPKIFPRSSIDRDDFNRYSGTNYDAAKRFLKKAISEIPEWNGFSFELFHSGYDGFTIYDGEKNLGYLMYDKNRYGLEDVSVGRGWYFMPKKDIDPKWNVSSWEKTIGNLARKDQSFPDQHPWG